MSTMIAASDILSRGYFPKELPPPFKTVSLGQSFAQLDKSAVKFSQLIRTSYSKYASIQRPLGIPNPVHFVPLAEAVADSWTELVTACNKSSISFTAPKVDSARAIVWSESFEKVAEMRAMNRVGARYVVQTDVASYYASLYTHSVPWALHTKQRAKQTRGHSGLLGDRLDALLRNCQSQQTVGVPTGPDTSVPIAEAVLSAVDVELMKRLDSKTRVFRFVDDYEFAVDTLDQAECVRDALQETLAEYELFLNPRKTRIFELPASMDTVWVQELSDFSFGLHGGVSKVTGTRILRFFSRAFELARSFPSEPVLKYATKRVADLEPMDNDARLMLQRLLLQAATVDPACLPIVATILWNHQGLGTLLNGGSDLKDAINAVLARRSTASHGVDVAWALWVACSFGLSIEDSVADGLLGMKDPIAVLMWLHARDVAVIKTSTATRWERWVDSSEMFTPNWLIAYEAYGKGWLTASVDPAGGDPFFASARQAQVEFFDTKAKLSRLTVPIGGDYS